MNKFPSLLTLAFFLAACVPQTAVVPTPTRVKDLPTAPPTLPDRTRIIIRSSSMSLFVDDPSKALSALEQAVQDAGGFVVSASFYSSPVYPGYSSLNAQVPPESLPELRRVAMEIASEVQSDSLYSQDVSSEFRLLHRRLMQLQRSEDHLWQLATETKDHDLADSLTLLRDLIQQEMVGIEGQLLDLEDRSTFATFDVTLNQTVQTTIFIK
jgi:hypothetical protein